MKGDLRPFILSEEIADLNPGSAIYEPDIFGV